MSKITTQLDNPDDTQNISNSENDLLIKIIHYIRQSIDISDHEIPLKIVRNCFYADEAINTLVHSEYVKSREKAINICEILFINHVILPTQNVNKFIVFNYIINQDKHILYRFYCDQDNKHLSEYPLSKDIISKWRFSPHTITNRYL